MLIQVPAGKRLEPVELFRPDKSNMEYTPQQWMFRPEYLVKNDMTIFAPYSTPTSIIEVLRGAWYTEQGGVQKLTKPSGSRKRKHKESRSLGTCLCRVATLVPDGC